MRNTSSWERLWVQLRESTEGPTVTLQVPREVADQLLDMLSTSLEVDDGEDDLDGFSDGDDMGFQIPGMGPDDGDDSDDDMMPSFSASDDEGPDDDDEDDDDSGEDDAEEDDDDDDEDDEKDESANPFRSPRTQTALGESRRMIAESRRRSVRRR